MRAEQKRIFITQQLKSYWIDQSKLALIEHLQTYSRVVFVCDSNTISYAQEMMLEVPNAIIEQIPVGESSKSFMQLELSCERLAGKLDRKSAVVGVGGGVVGDFAGFLASIFLRGIDLYLVPTSLLSMVDSSIGGKTAINLKHAKNLVGSFVNPCGVWLHFESLKTLSREHYYSGFGEMIKHAILDSSQLLQRTLASLHNGKDLEDLVFESIRIKKSVVEKDFKELGLRKCLNLGHTVGHALEMAYQLDRAHGLCVFEGLLIEHRIAQVLGYIEGSWIDDLEKVWSSIGCQSFNGDPEDLFPYLMQDKKNEIGKISFSFCHQPGQLAWFDEQPVLSIEPERFIDLLRSVL